MSKLHAHSLLTNPPLRYIFRIVVLLTLLASCSLPSVDPYSADSRKLVLEEDEKELWDTAKYIEKKIEKHTTPFEGQDAVDQYLKEIIMHLVPDFLENQEDRIRVHVLIADTPNAFVLPNGATYVTSGLLAALENEAQLATILGHEISHFIHRHGLRQCRKNQHAQRRGRLFGIFLGGLVGATTGTFDADLTTAAADLWRVVSVSGYSRDLEREADRYGLIAMLKAGYHPNAAIRSFEMLLPDSDDSQDKQYSFFASHPKLTERIASYKDYLKLPEIKQFVIGKVLGEERFGKAILPVLLKASESLIKNGKTKKALLLIQRYRCLHPKCPRAVFLLGEACRHESKRVGDRAMMNAVTHYREAITLDPTYADCYRELGLLYRVMNQVTAYREMFSKYLELVPGAPDAPIIRSFMK